jgi:hypothetical protein
MKALLNRFVCDEKERDDCLKIAKTVKLLGAYEEAQKSLLLANMWSAI